jgi:hypothetical protein
LVSYEMKFPGFISCLVSLSAVRIHGVGEAYGCTSGFSFVWRSERVLE